MYDIKVCNVLYDAHFDREQAAARTGT